MDRALPLEAERPGHRVSARPNCATGEMATQAVRSCHEGEGGPWALPQCLQQAEVRHLWPMPARVAVLRGDHSDEDTDESC